MSEAILDAGPLIQLDELDALDVLSDFTILQVPHSVWEEVEKYRSGALMKTSLGLQHNPSPIVPENLQVLAKSFSLDLGEAEALALLISNPQAMFLTDDAAARMVAEQLGFRVHGTIGLLIRNVWQGIRKPAEILALIRNIPERSTLDIRPALLAEIVQRTEHEWNVK